MKKIVFLIAVAALFVSACGGGAQPTVPDANALSTQIAATVNAALSVVLPTSAPVATKAPIATPAPAPTATPAPAAATGTPSSSGDASFSPITFAMGVADNCDPIDALDTFPSGVTGIYYIFSGINMQDGQTYNIKWYINGKLQTEMSHDVTWDASKVCSNGKYWRQIWYTSGGIETGNWEVKLSIDNQLAQSGQFTIEADTAPDFGPITFAGGQKNDKPVNPVDASDPTFPADTIKVYAFWDAINVPKGTAYTREWYFNGKLQVSNDDTWDLPPTDHDYSSFSYDDKLPLDPGTYELKLLIESKVVNIGSFIVSAK
jgi:hypothetical protein